MNIPEDIAYQKAKERVKQLKGFYIHLLVYVLVNAFIILNGWRKEQSLSDMELYYTALFWGIGLAAHAISIFVPQMLFSKGWEEKKVKELIEKEQQ